MPPLNTAKFSTAIALSLVAALLFIPFLGHVHLFDWDEINFAECAREMIVTKDYSRVYMNFKPFFEKPPMFFWMQSLSMHVFGVNEFAARFPNAVCGMATIVTVFLCGKKLFGKSFGILWAIAFLGSFFPNLYFKSGIIDPWFNLFTFLAFFNFILYHWKRNNYDKQGLNRSASTYAVFAGIFMGLSILTKGPAMLLVFMLSLFVYFVRNRFRLYFGIGHALLFLFTALIVSFLWYGYETIKDGPSFVISFFKYQYELFTTHSAGQAGFLGYHFVVIFFGCFPSSAFAIVSFFKSKYDSRYEKDFKSWMLILFWVILILFTITQSRIIHYSSMAWYPVSFLAAYTFYKWERIESAPNRWVKIALYITGGVLVLALTAVPFAAMNLDKIAPYVKDKFAQANMGAQVYWSGWESLIGVFLLVVIAVGLHNLKKNNFRKAAFIFFGGTAIVVFLASAVIVPKVERYSQGAAVDFFIQRRGEDCYVDVLGYTSYAQFFYTQKKKPVNENAYNQEWLLTGNIDKPVYFVSKVNTVSEFEKYPELKELYRKNGFVFLKRDIPKNSQYAQQF